MTDAKVRIAALYSGTHDCNAVSTVTSQPPQARPEDPIPKGPLNPTSAPPPQPSQRLQGAGAERAATRPGSFNDQLVFIGVLALLLTPPLFRGALSPFAALLLEALGLALVALTLLRDEPPALGRAHWTFLAVLGVVPLLYLLELPDSLQALWPALRATPAAIRDAEALVRAGLNAQGTEPITGPLSLDPLASEAAWLLLLIPIGVYLGTRTLPQAQQKQLLLVFFAIAVVQSVLALLQFGASFSGLPFPFSPGLERYNASGTYGNRNHLAGMLELAFPIALALFLHDFGRRTKRDRRGASWRKRIATLLSSAERSSLSYALLAILFITAIVITRSRVGIAMAMLGILLSALLFSQRVGGRNTFGLTGQVITISIGLALAIGLAPILDRFSLSGVAGDARWPIALATWQGAQQFTALGSGPGTFAGTFPLFQPVELGRWLVNQAHNDYLQGLFEVGLFALALPLLFIALSIRQWRRLFTPEPWSQFRAAQIGAGVALLLLLIHSLFDFNLRNHANLGYFAFIAGLFFAPPGHLTLTERKQRKRSHTRVASSAWAEVPIRPAGNHPRLSDGKTQNPFDA
jgi:hypothetical protein